LLRDCFEAGIEGRIILKRNAEEIEWEGVKWIHLYENMDQLVG
jgi:hypothetical protein